MKNVILATALTMTMTATCAMAAPSLDNGAKSKLVSVCKAIKSGSKVKLAKAVKTANLNYEQVALDLRCNGMDAIAFAQHNDQFSTANYLAAVTGDAANELIAKRSN